MNSFRLPDATHIGYVHLQVSNAGRSLAFYKELLGFKEVQRDGATIFLSSTGRAPFHLILTERPDAKPIVRHSTGLFHTAIRLPNRKELARTFTRLYDQRWPFQGFADHGVSEALYLADTDGNGIELYTDRPRNQWPRKNDELEIVSIELDLDNLLEELTNDKSDWNGIHPATDIGHIHLQVSDLAKAKRFYHEVLGFDITQGTYPGALFVSAGGYHHHIGFNIWNSRGASTPSPDAVGLVSFAVAVPDKKNVDGLQEKLSSAGIEVRNEQRVAEKRLILRDFDGIQVEIISERDNS